MAENPFVDGITNLAIPDSPHGVDISGHEIPGRLYGIKSVIEGNADLLRIKVGSGCDLRGMCVYGHLQMYGAKIGDQNEVARLSNIVVEGDASFGGITTSCIELGGAKIKGKLRLGNGKIDYGLAGNGQVDVVDLHNAKVGGIHFDCGADNELGFVNLEGMVAKVIRFGNLFVKVLSLENAVIKSCDTNWPEVKISDHYIVNAKTRIPTEFQKFLEQYERVEK